MGDDDKEIYWVKELEDMLELDEYALGLSKLESKLDDLDYERSRGRYSDLHVEGDITINNLSLLERLEVIESALGLPQRDAELEQKYPHLKEMYNKQVTSVIGTMKTDMAYTKEMEKLRTFELVKGEKDEDV